jgi:hypothetical protein
MATKPRWTVRVRHNSARSIGCPLPGFAIAGEAARTRARLHPCASRARDSFSRRTVGKQLLPQLSRVAKSALACRTRGKATSTISYDSAVLDYMLGDQVQNAVERGTGLEPATSTLGTLRQHSTIVDDCLHALSLQSEMSKRVDIGPHRSVGKLWECGKKLRSVLGRSS